MFFIFISSFMLIEKNMEEKRFQFEKETPSYYTKLQVSEKTVMQSFAIDEINRHIYISQVKGGQDNKGAESFVITKTTMDGIMIDSMTLTYGGHGTSIGVEVTDGIVYIWSSYDKVDKKGTMIGHDLVRFKYIGGATYTPSSPSLERYSDLINTDPKVQIAPSIDNKNGKIAVRQRVGKKQKVDVYNIEDVLNNRNRKLYSFDVPTDLSYLQGLSLDGKFIYWRTGDTNGKKFKDLVTVFDITTGNIVLKEQITSGMDLAPYESNFREPEGVFMYTNPNTGEKSLYIGVVTGAPGKRINRLYVYHSPKKEKIFPTISFQ
ncbi:hypothetical protein [Neobacillus niacini]|uniref:phage baseplate protein n=1 Tax=Neobacillus niacini TaxID=86668 RepID=UPI003982E8DA